MQEKTNEKFTVVTSDGCAPDIFSGCVLALGHFDGVHLAHARLINEAIRLKKEAGLPLVGVWTFLESPSAYLSDNPIPYIYTPQKKTEILLSLGVDFVILADFEKFHGLSPEDFVLEHLIGELNCKGSVCGFNYRFGKDGMGDATLLTALFGADRTRVVEEIKIDGKTVSSTEIRRLIVEGDTEGAKKLLGRPFSLEAEVVSGKKLGHTIGIPTANQFFPKGSISPKQGIYATLCHFEDGSTRIGVSNVGIRPTISDEADDHSLNCETYITDFNRNIYGQKMKLEFFRRLRDEKKFESLEELKDTVLRDAETAKLLF